MSEEDLNKWMEKILELNKKDIKGIGMPLGVFFNEANETALAFHNFWETTKTRPGMSAVSGFMSQTIADDVISLVKVGNYVQSRIIFLNMKTSEKKELMERVFYIFSEIRAALEFILDDDVTESSDHALNKAKSRLAKDSYIGTIVQGLVDYSAIAEEKKDKLRMLGDFDLSLIEEAKELAPKIVEIGAIKADDEISENMKLRNRICTLIMLKVREIRRAARYVFRKHPDVIRKFTSTYQRRKRLETKRRQIANKTVNVNKQPET